MMTASARWLLHGPLDPPAGYAPASRIEVGRAEFQIDHAGTLRIEEATLLRVERLGRVASLQSPLAWRFEVGARRLAREGESPLNLGVEVGVGLGRAFVSRTSELTVYSMVGVRPGAEFGFQGSSAALAGLGSGGVILRFSRDVRLGVFGEYSAPATAIKRGAVSLDVVARKGIARNWDVELALRHEPYGSMASFGIASFR